MFCSGYGSGAVSSTTLSEDSLSVRSVSVDETPDKDLPANHATMDVSTIRWVGIYFTVQKLWFWIWQNFVKDSTTVLLNINNMFIWS